MLLQSNDDETSVSDDSSVECYSSVASITSMPGTDEWQSQFLEFIPHFSQVKPSDFKNYYSLSESNAETCKWLETNFSPSESFNSKINFHTAKENSNKLAAVKEASVKNQHKLNRLINFVSEKFLDSPNEQTKERCLKLGASLSTGSSSSIDTGLSAGSVTSLSGSSSSLSSLSSYLSTMPCQLPQTLLDKSQKVQDVATELQQKRTRLETNDIKIR